MPRSTRAAVPCSLPPCWPSPPYPPPAAADAPAAQGPRRVDPARVGRVDAEGACEVHRQARHVRPVRRLDHRHAWPSGRPCSTTRRTSTRPRPRTWTGQVVHAEAMLARWKGPEFGNEGGMTIRWAHEHVDQLAQGPQPGSGADHVRHQRPEQRAAGRVPETHARGRPASCLDNGTVVILSTIPPRAGIRSRPGGSPRPSAGLARS